jgi:hypothetical protein
MRNPWKDVNGEVQPPLFRLPAVAVTLQALVDLEEHSVVFGVQTVDPISDRLVALWSSAPTDLDRYLTTLHEAHKEFLRELHDATSPFPI